MNAQSARKLSPGSMTQNSMRHGSLASKGHPSLLPPDGRHGFDGARGPDVAAEMRGHTSSRLTKEHYIEPDETVHPVAVGLLESLAPLRSEDEW